MIDCLFCKLGRDEIPHYTVYEDNYILAFLDINPCVIGHTVVIPKKHSVTIVDTDDALCGPLLVGVKRTTQRIQSILKPEGFTIGLNHGKVAGQAIEHLHIHILPRWQADGGGSMHSVVRGGGDMTVEDVAKLFKSESVSSQRTNEAV